MQVYNVLGTYSFPYANVLLFLAPAIGILKGIQGSLGFHPPHSVGLRQDETGLATPKPWGVSLPF